MHTMINTKVKFVHYNAQKKQCLSSSPIDDSTQTQAQYLKSQKSNKQHKSFLDKLHCLNQTVAVFYDGTVSIIICFLTLNSGHSSLVFAF